MDLNDIGKCCNTSMTVNGTKTQCGSPQLMHIQIPNLALTLNGKKLEEVAHCSHMGWLDSDLSLARYLCSRTSKVANKIKSAKIRSCFTKKPVIAVYKQTILPLLDYIAASSRTQLGEIQLRSTKCCKTKR